MADSSVFDASRFCAEASEASGLTDFGPDDFRPGLQALVDTYRHAPLTEAGVIAKARFLRRMLDTRLRTAAALAAEPSILRRPIEEPIYIVGMARTGTTFLHRMLAEAAGVRVLARWEGLYPAPALGRADDAEQRRRAAMAEGRDPSFDAIREVKADLPEEDYLLLEPAMRMASGGEQFWEPFAAWASTCDQRPAYGYLGDLIRLLDWQRSSGRWLMKSPAHLANLDLLVEQFPDVRLVWTHRDPVEAVSSLCSLLHKAVSRVARVSPAEVGASLAAGVASQIEMALAARARLGDARFIDVGYRELVESPTEVAVRVAEQTGLAVTTQLEAQLERYAREHPQNALGQHHYAPSEYGLQPDELRERFQPYAERLPGLW